MKRILWCKRPTIKSKVVTGIVTFALLLSCFTGFLGGTVAHAASDAPPIAGGTPVDREYVAFRDISGEEWGFRTTLWVQDVTQCKNDKRECSADPGSSNSFEVAYCLHYNSQMPYDSREHKIQFDKETGLVQNAQKYWRYVPADRLIKNSVKNKTGQDANLRNIKKVLYHGYHDADDSKWQKDNQIQDAEFREGTQYALWHYTDNLDTSVSGWAWPNQNVKKVYEYLVDKDNKLPDAPIDYEIKYFHTNEKPSNSHYTEYQDIVSVGSEAPGQPPIKPEPKKTKILFKKTDEGTGKPLGGVTIRVTAISKVAEDGTILFDKTLNLTNDDNAALELEAGETYKIEETVVPDGYTKRNFEVSIDKTGNVTFKGGNADKGAVEYTSEAEGFKNAATMTLKNKNENATPIEIGTTVKLGKESSTKDKSLVKKLTESDMQNGFEITDTVSYKGLAEGNVYKLVAVLNKVEGDTVTPVRSFVSDPFVPDAEGRYDFRFSAQKGDVQLGDQPNSYVIYEYLFNNDTELKTQDGAAGGIADADKTNSIAKHENSKDKSQTFIVEKKTNKPVKAEIKVKKVLDGRDFQAGDEFEFTLEPGKNPSPKTTTVKVTDGTPVSFGEIEFTGAGTYEYTISEKAGNLPGVTYSKDKVTVTVNVTDPNGDGTLSAEVVYPAKKEAAEITNSYTPVEPTPAEQSLKTTVKAGESSGTEGKEATAQAGEVAVKDAVAYKGLEAGKEYVLKAELMEDGQKAIKTVYHVFTPQAADGEETVDFGTVELAAGKKYVVFESAIKMEDANKTGEGDKATYEAKDGKKWLEHKDASDKAQTVVVEKPVTPTPTPTEQSLKTTVKAGESSGTEGKEATAQAGEVAVKDTVAYKGLEAGKEYVLKAELMEDGQKAIKTVYHVFTPQAADGEETVDFGTVELAAGKKYVVFESAIKTEDANKTGEGDKATYEAKDGKKWLEHKDASDKAQTVVVEKPVTPTPTPAEQSLKTTVKAGESSGTEGKEATAQAGEVAVKDTVAYKGLEAGKEYVLKAELMEDGQKAIKTVYHVFTPQAADGEETVDFGTVELAAGKKYVVFESAIKTEDANKTGEGDKATYEAKDGKKWLEHKDASDKAQTVVVEKPVTPTPTPAEQSLKTTVKAGESSGTERKEATAQAGEVAVKDTVAYKGLEKGKEYILKAELMEDGQKAIKTVYHVFTPQAADGEETVDFGTVELAAGKKYVVFESAIKIEDANKTGEGDKATYEAKEGKKWLEHKDASDKAQTVVVEKPVTPTPPAPNTPDKPGNPNPDKPHPEDPGKSKKHKSAPKTGDDFGMVYGYGAVMLISAAAVVIRLRRKNTV